MKVKLTEIQIPEPIRFGTGNLEEMKETLRKYGMIHPIAVKPVRNLEAERLNSCKAPVSNGLKELEDGHSPKYELLAGYLRYKAAESLDWETIEVTVINPKDELNQFDLKVEENMKRRDLNPLELSELLIQRKRLWEEKNGPIVNGKSNLQYDDLCPNGQSFYEESSRIFRRCARDIYRFLQLQDLDPDLRIKVESGEMYYRKALEEHCTRHAKDKKKTKKRGMRLPQPPIDLTWTAHDFQKTFWQMAGFYEAVRLVENRVMNFSEIPEDQVLGMMSMSQGIQQWLQKFDSHIQEIMLQRTGMSILS